MKNTCSRSGFTLVEMAIVLVILALVLGGVLAGQSLIRAAELRNVTKEHEQYQTAIRSFKDKYQAWPGDMGNATKFWGRADTGGLSGQCANPATDTGTGKRTCNGNGNGLVYDTYLGEVAEYEAFRFWQHLSNADLIGGTYSGIKGTSGWVADVNVPGSKIAGAYWSIWPTAENTSAEIPHADYRNAMLFGVNAPSSTDLSPLNAEEARDIDTKMDDGRPMTGNILSYNHDECTDSAGNPDKTDAVYLLTSKAGCPVIFNNLF